MYSYKHAIIAKILLKTTYLIIISYASFNWMVISVYYLCGSNYSVFLKIPEVVIYSDSLLTL